MSKFYVKVSLLLLIVAFVLVIVSQATSYWLVRPGYHRGLWRSCWDNDAKSPCYKLDGQKGFDKKLWATRILAILTSVMSFVTMLLLLCYLRRNDGLANLRRIKAVIAFSIMAALLIFVGIAVYIARKSADKLDSYHYGWSFIIMAVAGAIHLLMILPLLLEIRRATSLGAYESI